MAKGYYRLQTPATLRKADYNIWLLFDGDFVTTLGEIIETNQGSGIEPVLEFEADEARKLGVGDSSQIGMVTVVRVRKPKRNPKFPHYIQLGDNEPYELESADGNIIWEGTWSNLPISLPRALRQLVDKEGRYDLHDDWYGFFTKSNPRKRKNIGIGDHDFDPNEPHTLCHTYSGANLRLAILKGEPVVVNTRQPKAKFYLNKYSEDEFGEFLSDLQDIGFSDGSSSECIKVSFLPKTWKITKLPLYEMWNYVFFTNKVTKSNPRKRKNRGAMTVPSYIARTPRSKATNKYVFPRQKSYPIGDLYHARTALVFALSPTNKSKRAKVVQAVAKAYPQYNWSSWWNSRRKKGVPTWASLLKKKLR